MNAEDLCRGCIAIIAEKPRAAAKIAKALSGGRARRILYNGVPIWLFTIDGKSYVVIPSAGHLFSIDSNKKGIPVFEYTWVPRHLAEKSYRHLEKFYRVFSELLPRAREYINACDYDIEGSVIGYMIIKKWGDVSRMRRMKFSSLVDEELRRSFRNLMPPDMDMVEAGLARHEMDWIWGINVSRALMMLFRRIFGEDRVLSAGRVQTPTLFEVVRNTIERDTYVPSPLYGVSIYVEINGREYRLEGAGEPFKRKSEAEEYLGRVRALGYAVVSNIEERVSQYDPPHPFNLGDIQKEAYRIYRISPAKTLEILEDLYLDSLISYPRTNSQKLPQGVDHRGIIGRIGSMQRYRGAALKILSNGRLTPNNGPMDDPAHPAIYPTGEIPRRLGDLHEKIYDLIVRRYLATFAEPLVVYGVTSHIDVAGRRYLLRGARIRYKGWLDIYPFHRIEEKPIPQLRVGERLRISKARVVLSLTRPEPPYNKASLLKWMESQGIGTEATRAEIIETLYKRGYIKGSRATELGIIVCSAIDRYFKDLSRVELTRHFEELLDKIRRGELRREHVVKRTIEVVGMAIERFLKSIDSTKPGDIDLPGVKKGECPICGDPRDPGDEHGFCYLHSLAYRRIVEKYREWSENNYSWDKYLEKIYSLKITGSKVKEVIRYIEKQGLAQDHPK